ncbi:TnpV protein [Agathobacter rectalis]|uniref:TnpV protein n=1 Tax=Agathobacter rectalis TaxID=39491 RepID=A0A3E4LYV0_9FIRM|nr:TnpV protein [Agathobacter rectalis]
MNMELDYMQSGDYLIPNIVPNQQSNEPLGRMARLHRRWLETKHHGNFTALLMQGVLEDTCLEVGHKAEAEIDRLMEKMMKEENVTEELKRQDQMEWVRQVNNIKARAEEIVLETIVYTL